MYIVNILIGLLGSTIYSTGVVLQKKGSGWSALKAKKDRKYFARMAAWFAGIILSYILSGLPTGYASRYLLPQVISALSGWGVVTMVILSYFLLKEKMYLSDIVYSGVIVAAIITLSLSSYAGSDIVINTRKLIYLAISPAVLLLLIFLKPGIDKWRAAMLSMFSGAMAGFSLVIMNILVKESGFSVGKLLSSKYIYIYLITSFIAAVSIQFAYKYGDMIMIAPLQTSLTIIYPIICTFFMVQKGVTVVQILSGLVIVFSCKGILKKR